jgi:hypothetical protein
MTKDEIKRKGHFVTKHGEVKKRLGRPNADPDKLRKAWAELGARLLDADESARKGSGGGEMGG